MIVVLITNLLCLYMSIVEPKKYLLRIAFLNVLIFMYLFTSMVNKILLADRVINIIVILITLLFLMAISFVVGKKASK